MFWPQEAASEDDFILNYVDVTSSLRQKSWNQETWAAMDSERHVYRLKWWVRAGYLLVAMLLGGAGLTLVVIAILNRGWPGGPDLRSVAAMILCPLLGYVFPSLALRSKVTLEGDRLTVRYAFGEDSAQIGKIGGYRVVRARGGAYWQIRLRNGGSITIMRSYAVDDYFRDFISQLKPLRNKGEPELTEEVGN